MLVITDVYLPQRAKRYRASLKKSNNKISNISVQQSIVHDEKYNTENHATYNNKQKSDRIPEYLRGVGGALSSTYFKF